jgi:tryptophanyl-tRNA synthetase
MNIITGLQANSDLHIGNFFGAIKPMVDSYKKLTNEDKFFYFVPNLHSFTTPIDHSTLYKNTLNNIKYLLAAGINAENDNIYLFRQSRISEHAELAWTLQCFAYYGEASRMTQFKDKSLKNQNFSVGLLTYPILMAADILLYDCDYVPVGLDQQQHIELTRDLAQRFNNQFGETFLPPKEWKEQVQYQNLDKGLKIMSLVDPSKKMSKSDNDQKGCIYITDSPELIKKKIMGATTDSIGVVNYDPINQPGITNLITILSCVRSSPLEIVSNEVKGISRYGDFKTLVANEVSQYFQEYQIKLASLDNEYIESVLSKSESEVKKIANAKLLKVYKLLGL